MAKITVKNTSVSVIKVDDFDYISITDIAKYKTSEPDIVIANWMRNRMTIEYLGLWEILYNPDFKPLEFEGFKKEAGLNAFTLSPKKMDRDDKCYGYYFSFRSLWWNICA